MALGDYSAQLIVCEWLITLNTIHSVADDFHNSEWSLPWPMKRPGGTFWHSRTMQPYHVSNIIHGAMCVLVIKVYVLVLFP